METLIKLQEIAQYLGLKDIVSELEAIHKRSKQENATLILPFVGEFSSGKTTLINALTDSKKLETATKPTTATIYEVHFGCKNCYAKVVAEDGTLQTIDDIAHLKNDKLADAKVVTVFDTSTRVPSSTILVDTPGLSSPDPKHKQTLVNFLPQADGIILVSDINQQITKSITDFIDTLKLSRRPIYLVLTKSDTKSEKEIEVVKRYVSENSKIPVAQIAVVSAQKDNLKELYTLLDYIQKDKKNIIKQVDHQRTKNIINALTSHIEELMKASATDNDLDDAIRRSQYELDKIKRNIDRLIDSISEEIEECARESSRKFEDLVYTKLNSLVTGSSRNFDSEAISMINSTASLLSNEYKNNIYSLLHKKVQKQKGSDNEISLRSLENIDLSTIQLSNFNYNLDLNAMGHEYDGMIKTGVIAVATVGIGAAIAAGTAAGTGAGVVALDNALDAADTVSDIGSIYSNQQTGNRIEKLLGAAKDVYSNGTNNQIQNSQAAQHNINEKGMIDSMIGFVTDKMMSKPQRVRAIRNYIDSTLSTEFKSKIKSISVNLVSSIRDNLQNEASNIISQKTESLNQLKTEMREKRDLFNQKMEKLREFQTILLTI